MKIESKREIVLGIVSALLIVTGYLNFQKVQNKNIIAARNKNTIKEETLGDVELVNSDFLITENSIIENKLNENESESVLNNKANNKIENKIDIKLNDEIDNSIKKVDNDYFVKTKLDRDNMYSKMLESYEKIIDNEQITSDQKAIAIQEVDKINKYKNGIMISENLIKNKGFEEAVILINNDTVSVVVKKEMLLDTDIVKIQNIIESKLGFKAINISISNL